MAVCTTPQSDRAPGQKLAGRGQSRLLADPGEMTLKVGFGKEARLVQIRSAKCTVGSAVGCTLRVRGAGVVPLACWILRGPSGAVVRRLHGAATLNGGQFEEAALNNGDRLRIGGVELEVVDCSQPTQQPAARFPTPPPSVNAIELESKLADAMADMQRLEGQARQGFQSSIVAADRADQMRNALEAAHEQLGDTCRDLTAAQEAIAIANETIETQKRDIEAIKAGDEKSAALVEEARRETAAAVKQCAATGTELAQVRSELATEQTKWEEDRQQFEVRLEQRAAEIEALRNGAVGQAGAMTVVFGRDGSQLGERAELEEQLKSLEEQTAAKDREIEALRQRGADQAAVTIQLEALQREHEIKCNELIAAHDRIVATEQQLATFSQQVATAAELDARAQSLAQQEEGLLERERSVGAAAQQCGEERGALASQAEQLSAERQKVTEERDQAAQARQQVEQNCTQLEQERTQFELDRTQLEQDRAQLAQDSELRAEFGAKQEALEERELQLQSLEEQTAAKDREIELLRQREADQAGVTVQLEALQREHEIKCNELIGTHERIVATEQQLATLSQQVATAAELDARAQSLAQQEERLLERERSVSAAAQQCGEERGALAAQAEQLSAERQKVTEERDQAAQARQQVEQERTQLEQNRAQLAYGGELRAEFEAKQEALEERELQLESQAADLANQVADASARATGLEAHREQLAAERASLDERGQCLQRQQVDLEARAVELEAKTAEINLLREELNAQAAAVRHEQVSNAASGDSSGGIDHSDSPSPSVVVTSAWQSPEVMEQVSLENVVDDAVPTEGSGENARESAGVDVVLSRLVKAGLWRGNEGADSGQEPSAAAAEGAVSQTITANEPASEPVAAAATREAAESSRPAPAPLPVQPRPAQARGDEEESIESYMDRLMKRVRGDSTPVESKSSLFVKQVEEVAPPPAATPEPSSPPESVEEVAEYSPRRTAPELSSMSAMRELANTAARSAIDKHVRTHSGKLATGKLFGACLTVCISLVLAYWAWHGRSLPATVGAVIGVCLGLHWTLAAVRRLFSLMKLNRPQEEKPAIVNAVAEEPAPVEVTP